MSNHDAESKERAIHIYETETGNVRATINGNMKWLEALFMLEMAADLVKQKMMENGKVIRPVVRPGLVETGGR